MDSPMIKEMEAAYATVGELKDSTHEKRVEATSRAVQKYFPAGMKKEEAFKLLRQLKEQGFEISETRYDGGRAWPDGEFKPYLGEVGRLTHQRRYPKGMSEFLATKKYATHFSIKMLFVTKHVAISFRVDDDSGVVSESKGSLSASGI